MKNEGIERIEDFAGKTRQELLAIPHFGEKCLQLVEKELKMRGLSLKDDS
jgi:DNA-directed RNA polymerase alpha subunit